MAGHHLVTDHRDKTSTALISGKQYKIQLSYHNIKGISGSVVGIKFSDASNSMDSSKKGQVSGVLLGRAIGEKVVQMVMPDIDKISILGFYLLTDDLSTRGKRAVFIKERVYGNQAKEIHNYVKHKLPVLRMLKTNGGTGWAMSKEGTMDDFQIQLLERELGKRLEVLS